MIKTIFGLIFVLVSMELGFSQNVYDVTSRVKVSDIKDAKLQEAFEGYQTHDYYINLPFFEDALHADEYNRTSPSFVYEDPTSPFYVNLDRRSKERNDWETGVRLFKKTTGNYILGEVSTSQEGLLITKTWLVTFDPTGKRIDYLPIWEIFSSGVAIIEGQVQEDLTVDIQSLNFPGYDYIARFDTVTTRNVFPDSLIGQRIDSKYRITPQGKFEKQKEIRYEPQNYSALFREFDWKHPVLIRQRNEKRLPE